MMRVNDKVAFAALQFFASSAPDFRNFFHGPKGAGNNSVEKLAQLGLLQQAPTGRASFYAITEKGKEVLVTRDIAPLWAARARGELPPVQIRYDDPPLPPALAEISDENPPDEITLPAGFLAAEADPIYGDPLRPKFTVLRQRAARKSLPQPIRSQPFSTAFLLMAQYGGGTAVIPLEDVCRDYFRHLTPEILTRKAMRGEIALPIVRMEHSQKAAKGVALVDLAAYLDERIAAARKELRQMTS